MREAIEISTGKHLETIGEINESDSAFTCPACGLPVTPVHKNELIDYLKHPPYSRFYLPDLCPNMSSNFSKGTPGSFDNRSVNWNFNHLLKRLSRGLDLEGIEILTAVLNSRKREQQEHTTLIAEGVQKLKTAESEASWIRKRAELEGRAEGLKLGKAEYEKQIEEAKNVTSFWFEKMSAAKEVTEKRKEQSKRETDFMLHLQQDREALELEKKEWREKHESGSI